MKSILNARFFLLLTLLLIAVAFPLITDRPFYLNIMIFIFLYALLGIGWNIIGGYAGQPALGNAVFFGLGAYSTGVLVKWWGITPWLGLVAGMVVAIIASICLGYLCFRLRGHYFAIATFAIGETCRQAFNCWTLVEGANGLQMPVLPESWLNFQFHSSRAPYYFIILGFALLAFLINYRLERTQMGYYLRAIRADEEVAASVGINTTKYKIVAFALAAAMTAAGGTFYAMFVLFFDPMSVFSFATSLQAMLVTVLGGIGTIWGPIVGSIILVVLSETSRVLLGGTGRAVDLLVYGFLIMAFAVLEPNGLAGLGRRLRAKMTGRRVRWLFWRSKV